MAVWKLSVAVQLGSGFQATEEEFEELRRMYIIVTLLIPASVSRRLCHFIFLPVGRFLLRLSWFRT